MVIAILSVGVILAAPLVIPYDDDSDYVPNNFYSRSAVVHPNINGKDVTMDILSRSEGEQYFNPNFSQALLLSQCIDYKIAHPDEQVTMTMSSFHMSIVAAACVDRNSEDFGKMKSLYDVPEDDSGYIRLSELVIKAAKYGIETIVVGQTNSAPTLHGDVWMDDIEFAPYFESRLDESCFGDLSDHKVSDFMTFGNCKWTSYGDKAATDMMHLKAASVSAYRDYKGVDHEGTICLTSANLDGIDGNGSNGYDSFQTGVIISDHNELCRTVERYTRMLSKYCGQDDVAVFRSKVLDLNKRLIDEGISGVPSGVPDDERILYYGTENDRIFRLYFTPICGPAGEWNTTYNPLCEFLSKMADSNGYIEILWNNPNFHPDFDLSIMMLETVRDSFLKNTNPRNLLYLKLRIDSPMFDEVQRINNGTVAINKVDFQFHMKDLQVSYMENNVRHYISIINTMNVHYGGMFYQTNSILVIDETGINDAGTFYSEFKNQVMHL